MLVLSALLAAGIAGCLATFFCERRAWHQCWWQSCVWRTVLYFSCRPLLQLHSLPVKAVVVVVVRRAIDVWFELGAAHGSYHVCIYLATFLLDSLLSLLLQLAAGLLPRYAATCHCMWANGVWGEFDWYVCFKLSLALPDDVMWMVCGWLIREAWLSWLIQQLSAQSGPHFRGDRRIGWRWFKAKKKIESMLPARQLKCDNDIGSWTRGWCCMCYLFSALRFASSSLG